MLEGVQSLINESEDLIETCENLMDAAPEVDEAALESEVEKDLAKEIELIGDKQLTSKVISQLDNGDYQKVEAEILGSHLSEAEYKEFIKRYVGARISNALRLYEYEEGNYKTLRRKLEKVKQRNQNYDSVTKQDMAFSIGISIVETDKENLKRAEMEAAEADRCISHYNIERTDEFREPVPIVKDIRKISKETQDLESRIEKFLGMNKKEIISAYKQRDQEISG